jgi:hypothetical protein
MMLSGLADPVTIYRGEESLYNALTATMEQLVAGHTVFAICTDKTWDAEPVKWYLDANARAKARGVSITRIFYEMRGNVASEAQKQADQGINVLLLRAEKLSELKPIHCVPPHLGIAIINEKTVFLHSGLGDEAVACRYECPHLASVIRSEFEVVERVSDPVDPRIPSVQPDKTVWHEHVIP